VTNGSLLTSRLGRMLDQHGADPAKLTLWITYHHTEITAEHLVDNAIYAARYGVFVVVNALLFPDTIEPIARLHRLCAAHDLRTNVDLGQDFNDAYAGSPFIPLAGDAMALPAGALAQNVKMAQLSVVAAASPQGLACSAGHDYVFINRRGEVYPCLGYLRYRPGAKLGCALDPGFVLSPRAGKYAPCAIAKGCTCKEDFLHLEAAAPGPSREHSLGYWPPSADATIDPVLTQRLDRIKQSAVLDDAPFWSRHINGRVTPG
jgi:hypothetical protein